ncbi:putative transcriptional regulator (plasmid) [Rhizobium phaseoli Ch24-10]|nr:putative transcriptional regulator [Rhizobium phaseoli Ch24-10]
MRLGSILLDVKEILMSVKSSISLTEQQDAFARSLVDNGRYSSLSSVLQQGLELLRQKTEAEAAETEALRELIQRRLNGPALSDEAMADAVDEVIERKRRALRVET